MVPLLTKKYPKCILRTTCFPCGEPSRCPRWRSQSSHGVWLMLSASAKVWPHGAYRKLNSRSKKCWYPSKASCSTKYAHNHVFSLSYYTYIESFPLNPVVKDPVSSRMEILLAIVIQDKKNVGACIRWPEQSPQIALPPLIPQPNPSQTPALRAVHP